MSSSFLTVRQAVALALALPLRLADVTGGHVRRDAVTGGCRAGLNTWAAFAEEHKKRIDMNQLCMALQRCAFTVESLWHPAVFESPEERTWWWRGRSINLVYKAGAEEPRSINKNPIE